VYRTTEDGDLTTADFTVTAGATYTTLVHGVSLTLAGTLTTGHKARVYPAVFTLDGGLFYSVRGETGDSVKLAVYNPGSVTHKVASFRVGRAAWFENTSGTALAAIHIGRDTILADEYALTISNGTSSGKKFTFTGANNTYIADNVANSAINVPLSGTIDTGLTFDAGSAPGNTNTATLHVSDLADALQLAPDNAGAPGTWVSWNDTTALSIPLNRPGYTDQQVPAAQTIFLWVRANPDITQPLGRGIARMYPRSHKAE
jgi:hypothetical protein